MSNNRTTHIPTVVYVNIQESFEKICIWQYWDKLNPNLKQQLKEQLIALGWKQKGADKHILVKKFSAGTITIHARVNLETHEITMKGNFSKSVQDINAGKERKQGKKDLERAVMECEITMLQELNQAFNALEVEISTFDHFNLRVEWQSIVGENPGDFLPRLLRDSGFQEESQEPGVYVKPISESRQGCQLRMDLNRMEAVICIARAKTIYLKDEESQKNRLQKELFDDIEQIKDRALLDLNCLKQQVYKEALMEYARSRGDVSVTSDETGDRFHMVIEITREVQS